MSVTQVTMYQRAIPKLALAGALLLLGLGPLEARGEVWHLALDPAASQVTFELGATLHTVRGGFAVQGGDLHLDEKTGAFAGRVVVDARSGDTGNGTRDANMHEQVLESQRFPEIVLWPETFELETRGDSSLHGTLAGRLELHGDAHPVRFEIEAERLAPDRGSVRGSFEVPYVAWGLADLSTFVLRVDKVLRVSFEVEGALKTDAVQAAP